MLNKILYSNYSNYYTDNMNILMYLYGTGNMFLFIFWSIVLTIKEV